MLRHAPSIHQRKTNPLDVMKDMSSIITTGTLKKDNLRMPAILSIMEGENPILRSWEYTVASLGARREGSNKRNGLKSSLFGTGGLSTLQPFTLSGLCKGGEQEKIEKALAQSFAFTFESDRELGQVFGDQRSEKGMWAMKYREQKGGGYIERPVESWEDFEPKLRQILKQELPGREREIDKHLDNPKFTSSITQEFMSKPWIPGGSGGISSETASLFNGRKGQKEPVELLKATVEERATVLLTKVTQLLAGKTQTGPLIDTPNHSVNIVPGQIELLAGKNENEIKNNISEKLGRPGQQIAKTPLEQPRASYLFQKLAKTYKDALQGVKPPIGKPTPAEFKKYIRSQSKLSEDVIDSFLLGELRPPEVVVFNTNWGSSGAHKFWVMAPAPDTGVLTMWEKTEPDGTYERATDRLAGNWNLTL